MNVNTGSPALTNTHHLLHIVPVNQSVWISEVSLVVLVISHSKLATKTHNSELNPTALASAINTVSCLRSYLLGLQKKLLVKGLVLMAPLISAAPARGASISNTAITSTGFKSEVQQVVQAYFLGSRKLSRAKLGPARLCYLEMQKWVEGIFYPRYYSGFSCKYTTSLKKMSEIKYNYTIKKKHQPPHVVLHLQRHTVEHHLSEGVSCQNSCFSVNWCGEGLGNCRF